MDSKNLSPDDPTYDATEDPMAPYRLSLFYTPILDGDLPSLALAPDELGDLSLFQEMPPLQILPSWDWAEGLQAIEDFDWSAPEDVAELTAASPPLYSEYTAAKQVEHRAENLATTGRQLAVRSKAVQPISPQHEDERPGKKQKLEAQPSPAEMPISPPRVASPEAPNHNSSATSTTVPAHLGIVTTDGGDRTGASTTEMPVLPPWAAISEALIRDPTHTATAVPTNPEIVAIDEGYKDTNMEPEATRSAILNETESEPTIATSFATPQDRMDLSAVPEDIQQLSDSPSWDTQLQAAVLGGSDDNALETLPEGQEGAEEVEQEPSHARPVSNGPAHEDVSDTLLEPSSTSDQRPPPLDEHLDVNTTILATTEIASKSLATEGNQIMHEQNDASDIPTLISVAECTGKRETTPEPKEQDLAEEQSETSDTPDWTFASRKNPESSPIVSVKRSAASLKRPKAIKSPRDSTRERFGKLYDGTTQGETNESASAETYFEEDTRPDNSEVSGLRRHEDIQAPVNDDDEYDMQERLTDVEGSASPRSGKSSYQRPPRNPVSNRELAALGSTFTPGMHLGSHHGQPKRARKSNERPVDSETSSDVEITHVKKKRTAPASSSKKAPAPKKSKVEQRTQAEIDQSEEEHDELSPEPRFVTKPTATKGKKTPANGKRNTRTDTSSAPTSDAEEKPKSSKRTSLLKNTLATPSPALTKNKFGFTQRKTRTPVKTPGGDKRKGKGKKGEDAGTSGSEGAKRPLTRRTSLQLEKESNIGKRLRSGD